MLVYQRVVQALFVSSAACDLQDDKHILCSGVVRASGYLHFAAEFGALLAVGKKTDAHVVQELHIFIFHHDTPLGLSENRVYSQL